MIGFSISKIDPSVLLVMVNRDKYDVREVVTDADIEAVPALWSSPGSEGRPRLLLVFALPQLERLMQHEDAVKATAHVVVFLSDHEMERIPGLRVLDRDVSAHELGPRLYDFLSTSLEQAGRGFDLQVNAIVKTPTAAPSASLPPASATPGRLRALLADATNQIENREARQALLVAFARLLTRQDADPDPIFDTLVRAGFSSDLVRRVIRAAGDREADRLMRAYVLASVDGVSRDRAVGFAKANAEDFNFVAEILPPQAQREFVELPDDLLETVRKIKLKKQQRDREKAAGKEVR